jgi:glycosyltransferase involved in cell wall biosynthesis
MLTTIYTDIAMKILISIGSLGLGGAEKQAVWLANNLSANHEVTLLTYYGGAREKDLGPKVNWRTLYQTQNDTKNQGFNSKELQLEEELSTSSEAISRECNSFIPTSKLNLLEDKVKTLFKNFPLTLKLLRYFYIKCMPLIQVVRSWSGLVREIALYLTLPKHRQNKKGQTHVFISARRIVKDVHPDLIITFLFHDTLSIGLAGLTQINRPKLIVGRRSPIGYGDSSRKYFHRLALKIIYKFADLAVSNSSGNLESAIRDGVSKRKIIVIENFVSKNNLSEVQTTKVEPLEILCIANFHWYKNHEGLIRAVATIPNHEKRFCITFVGDGPLLDVIRQLTSELRVTSIFRGFLDNPSAEIPSFQALILVSHFEGSSNALLEGLVCGIPAVVSDVGSAQELLSQGAPLILCDSYDTSSIANAIIQLSENYEALRREAGDFSTILSESLSEDTVLKKWQEAIRKVTSS